MGIWACLNKGHGTADHDREYVWIKAMAQQITIVNILNKSNIFKTGTGLHKADVYSLVKYWRNNGFIWNIL
jgi:hypothetical protein